MWDPTQYERFATERSRPFFDLVDRIGAEPREVRRVVDLGCGTGSLTATLAERWPQAEVEGVDRSPEMLRAASRLADDRLRFREADLARWAPSAPVDVIVTNAALQWVPDHATTVLPRLVGHLRPGGWFAMQVPGNLADAHHEAIAAVATREAWAPLVGADVREFSDVLDPAGYADVLAPLGCSVDCWETTYLHVLEGDDPVLEWVKGTALRPVLARLEHAASAPAQTRLAEELKAAFCRELAPLLRRAYPPRPYGTPFPFRRVFAVARRSGDA